MLHVAFEGGQQRTSLTIVRMRLNTSLLSMSKHVPRVTTLARVTIAVLNFVTSTTELIITMSSRAERKSQTTERQLSLTWFGPAPRMPALKRRPARTSDVIWLIL